MADLAERTYPALLVRLGERASVSASARSVDPVADIAVWARRSALGAPACLTLLQGWRRHASFVLEAFRTRFGGEVDRAA